MSSVQKPCSEIEQCAKDQTVYSTNSYYWFVAHCLENWGDAGPQDRIELFLWPVHKLCLTWELPVWESTHPPCAIFRDKLSRREEEWLPKMFTSTLSKAQHFCGGIGLLVTGFFPLGRLVWIQCGHIPGQQCLPSPLPHSSPWLLIWFFCLSCSIPAPEQQISVVPARIIGVVFNFLVTAKMFLSEIVKVSVSKGSELLSTGIQSKMGEECHMVSVWGILEKKLKFPM